MSKNKSGPSPTMFLNASEAKQQALKDARDMAAKNKQEAIKLATQPMGFCLFIAVFILIVFIAPPLALVLL